MEKETLTSLSTFVVRKATIADAATIISFQTSMAKETEGIDLDQAALTRGVRIPLEREGIAQYYVAERHDADTVPVDAEHPLAIAMLMLTNEWSDWRGGTMYWIQSVYTHPNYRRKGAYKQMYRHLQQMVMDDEFAVGLRLYVEEENCVARKMYESLGMKREHYNMMKWTKTKY
jgi:ribosomal protein S18 acetylase RimI-like enzyme